MKISVTTRQVGAAVIIDIKGDVDLYTSPEVRKVILEWIKEGKVEKVIVNLSGVPYIDSSGVGSLVEALQWANRQGRAFSLFGLTPRARAVFELARLDKVFRIFATEEEALNS